MKKRISFIFLICTSLTFASEKNELQLQLLIHNEQIQERIEKVARTLEETYKGEAITIVMVMKGSFIFVADLIRQLQLPVCVETVRCSSYGKGGLYTGTLTVSGVEELQIEGKHVVIIDDIFDSGRTLTKVAMALQEKNPASLKSLVLLSKNVPHRTEYRPDLVLFDIEDRFVIGYGLDYEQYYRGLPDIYAVKG